MDYLEVIGENIGKYLTILTYTLFILFSFLLIMDSLFNNSKNQSGIIDSFVSLLIPTEGSIVEIFSRLGGLVLVIVLLFYWIYVKPHER